MGKSKDIKYNEATSHEGTANSSLALGMMGTINKLLHENGVLNNAIDDLRTSTTSAYSSSSACSSTSSIPSRYASATYSLISIDHVYEKLCALEDFIHEHTLAKAVTNLDMIKQFNAEQLAYFIVHDAKTIISGTGNAEAELAEYFKQNID